MWRKNFLYAVPAVHEHTHSEIHSTRLSPPRFPLPGLRVHLLILVDPEMIFINHPPTTVYVCTMYCTGFFAFAWALRACCHWQAFSHARLEKKMVMMVDFHFSLHRWYNAHWQVTCDQCMSVSVYKYMHTYVCSFSGLDSESE